MIPLRLTTLALLLLYFTGCQIIETTDRVIYEDGSPVKFALVEEWNEEWIGESYTDETGTWRMTSPAGAIVELCITDPDRGIGRACYNGQIEVPKQSGSLESGIRKGE